MVGLSANTSVFLLRLVTLFDQSGYGSQQKDYLDSESHKKDPHAASEISTFLYAFQLLTLLLIEGLFIEKESAERPNSDDKRNKVSEKDGQVLGELSGSARSSQKDVL